MIHASAVDLSGREQEYVNDCLSRGWITQGRYVKRFEESFAEMCGVRYAIACNSGTSALHLIMLAIGVGSNDTITVPSLTYIATANAARYCGAGVIFDDIDPDNWCSDTDASDRLYSDYSIAVNLYDSVANIDPLASSTTIEDSCHAPNKRLEGLAAAHSFYASKIIACGEGGMVTTNDQGLADLVRLYRGQGATITGRYYHSVVGYNYRMTELQAAIGLAQLERLPEILARRREIVDRYRSNLLSSTITLQGGERSSGWVCAVLLPEGVDRDSVAARLYDQGVETRPFFEPLHTLPPYIDCEGKCPAAESIARRGLCLPTHTLLSDNDIDYVCGRLMVEAANAVAD